MLYSPLPMSAYTIPGGPARTAWIARQTHAEAAWNLYWLSDPSLDQPLLAPAPRTGLETVIDDVHSDAVLRAKLLLPPSQFLSWFEVEDASIFDCYYVFGPEWPQMVASRAAQAAARLAGAGQAQVVHVDFRRRA